MSQPVHFNEGEHEYQPSAPSLEYDYLTGYSTHLNKQSSSPRINRKPERQRTTISTSWPHLVVAIVSLLVLIVTAYVLLAYSLDYNTNNGYDTRLIALVIISITIILINFLFKKR